MLRILLIVTLFLVGCSDDISKSFSKESDAARLLNSAIKGEDRVVWGYVAKEAVDQTLTAEEKEQAFLKFKDGGIGSISNGLKDALKITEKNPKIAEVGQKDEGGETIYALTATYSDEDGYILDNGDVARIIKIIVTKNNKRGIVTEVKYEKVLEVNQEASVRNKKNVALALFGQYVADKVKNKNNIKEILSMYKDGVTPIPELNSELQVVIDHISNRRFDELVKVVEVGGYSDRGDQLSISEGFGTILKKYVTIQNLTNIPLRINHTYDIQEYYHYQDGESCGGFFLYSCSPIYKSGYSDLLKGEQSSLSLYSQETDSASKNYREIKYYNGYRVTEQFNDGNWRYNWDDTKSLKVINYATTDISVWLE